MPSSDQQVATKISDRISEALVDDRLSASARGLFGFLAIRYANENIPAAATLTAEYPMGRDKIRAAMNELLEAGYLERDCYRRRGGQFVKVTRVSAGGTRDWISGHLPVVSSSSPTDSGSTTTDLLDSSGSSHVDNTSVANAPSVLCATASPRARKPSRHERPRSQWNAADIAREFDDMLTLRTQAIGQVNYGALASNIAAWRRKGASPDDVLNAMKIFLDDPRNLRTAGRGIQLWRGFVAWYQQNHQKIKDRTEDAYDEEFYRSIDEDGGLLTKRRF